MLKQSCLHLSLAISEMTALWASLSFLLDTSMAFPPKKSANSKQTQMTIFFLPPQSLEPGPLSFYKRKRCLLLLFFFFFFSICSYNFTDESIPSAVCYGGCSRCLQGRRLSQTSNLSPKRCGSWMQSQQSLMNIPWGFIWSGITESPPTAELLTLSRMEIDR